MSRSPFVSAAELCATPSRSLSQMLGHARAIERIDRVLSAFLGEPLAAHCRIANVAGRTVHLLADSPVWATRVRYRAADIAAHLRDSGTLPALAQIKVHVLREPVSPPRPRRAARAGISPTTASLLRSVAEATNNPGLARALARLARRAD